MRIDQIHDFIDDFLRKEQKGYRTPAQKDTAINSAQYRVFNEFLRVYAISNEAKEALAPFVKKKTFNTAADGTFSLVSGDNFQALTSIGIQYVDGSTIRNKPVPFPGEDELDSRLNSQLVKPTTTDPIGEVTGTGAYQLHPAAVYGGTIRFLRQPVEASYAYTQAGRTITYDNTTSVQLEWADKFHNKIIMAALTILGVNLDSQAVVEIAESLSKLQ